MKHVQQSLMAALAAAAFAACAGGREVHYSVADRCAGLSVAEAADLLGIPAAEVDKGVLGEMFDNACSLKSSSRMPGRAFAAITFSLHQEDSIARARSAFDRHESNLAAAVPAEPVSGLGDDAVWFGSQHPVALDRLLVRKGNVWIDVITSPQGKDGARRVAEAVLRKLVRRTAAGEPPTCLDRARAVSAEALWKGALAFAACFPPA